MFFFLPGAGAELAEILNIERQKLSIVVAAAGARGARGAGGGGGSEASSSSAVITASSAPSDPTAQPRLPRRQGCARTVPETQVGRV